MKQNAESINVSGKSKIYLYTTYAIFAALLCIFAPMAVPIGPIPISLTNFVLYLAVFLIGTKGTLISFVVYLLLGLAGLPVFSGYAGGAAKLAGPTGGYLIGFIPMIIIMGIIYAKTRKSPDPLNMTATFFGMIAGTAVAYVLGTAWFVLQMQCEWGYALTVCVVPFIGFDIAKIVIANILGRAIRRPLVRSGLIR